MADKKTWDDLTGAQQAGMGLLGVVQLGCWWPRRST